MFVTALRMRMPVQKELERIAAAQGVGVSTLMREIIEDWVQANRTTPSDGLAELRRHMDAAQRMVQSLGRPSSGPPAA